MQVEAWACRRIVSSAELQDRGLDSSVTGRGTHKDVSWTLAKLYKFDLQSNFRGTLEPMCPCRLGCSFLMGLMGFQSFLIVFAPFSLGTIRTPVLKLLSEF